MHTIGRRSESDIDAIVDEDPRLRPNEGVPNAFGEGQQRTVVESALPDLHEIYARPGGDPSPSQGAGAAIPGLARCRYGWLGGPWLERLRRDRTPDSSARPATTVIAPTPETAPRANGLASTCWSAGTV